MRDRIRGRRHGSYRPPRGRARPRGAREAPSSRRVRIRRADGRRCRRAGADPSPAPGRRAGFHGLRCVGAGRADVVHLRPALARRGVRRGRGGVRSGAAPGPAMARRPRRTLGLGRARPRHPAPDPAGDPARAGSRRSRAFGAACPSGAPQDRRVRACGRPRCLRGVVQLRHRHLQGARRRGPVGLVLPGPPRSRVRGAVHRLPPALLDEHRAHVGARAAVPDALSQRRDQHDRRQREPDARARGPVGVPDRRGGSALPPRDRRRRIRLGHPRRGRRAPHEGRR